MTKITSGRQIKAGRALLGWSQVELSERAGLHKNAVKYWECRDEISKGQAHTNGGAGRMCKALEDGGVIFVEGGATLAKIAA